MSLLSVTFGPFVLIVRCVGIGFPSSFLLARALLRSRGINGCVCVVILERLSVAICGGKRSGSRGSLGGRHRSQMGVTCQDMSYRVAWYCSVPFKDR